VSAPTEAAASLASRYIRAMRDGHTSVCIRIEQEAGLFGYPPELVTVGLQAIDNGQDGFLAVEDYMRGESDER